MEKLTVQVVRLLAFVANVVHGQQAFKSNQVISLSHVFMDSLWHLFCLYPRDQDRCCDQDSLHHCKNAPCWRALSLKIVWKVHALLEFFLVVGSLVPVLRLEGFYGFYPGIDKKALSALCWCCWWSHDWSFLVRFEQAQVQNISEEGGHYEQGLDVNSAWPVDHISADDASS